MSATDPASPEVEEPALSEARARDAIAALIDPAAFDGRPFHPDIEDDAEDARKSALALADSILTLPLGCERAARWHDDRARQTPDVFEQELHEVSAKALRAIVQQPELTTMDALAFARAAAQPQVPDHTALIAELRMWADAADKKPESRAVVPVMLHAIKALAAAPSVG